MPIGARTSDSVVATSGISGGPNELDEPAESVRVVMGRIVDAYGVMGWIKVLPFTASVDGLLDYRTWWIGSGDRWRQIAIAEARAHGATLVARPEGYGDRNAAIALKGLEVAVDRGALPEIGENEVYWADLEGLQVVNLQGESLGRIVEVFSNGAHDILRVRSGDGGEAVERLMPYVAAIVKAVDLLARRVTVDWGLDWS